MTGHPTHSGKPRRRGVVAAGDTGPPRPCGRSQTPSCPFLCWNQAASLAGAQHGARYPCARTRLSPPCRSPARCSCLTLFLRSVSDRRRYDAPERSKICARSCLPQTILHLALANAPRSAPNVYGRVVTMSARCCEQVRRPSRCVRLWEVRCRSSAQRFPSHPSQVKKQENGPANAALRAIGALGKVKSGARAAKRYLARRRPSAALCARRILGYVPGCRHALQVASVGPTGGNRGNGDQRAVVCAVFSCS